MRASSTNLLQLGTDDGELTPRFASDGASFGGRRRRRLTVRDRDATEARWRFRQCSADSIR